MRYNLEALHNTLLRFLLWAGIIGSTFAMNNGVFDVYQQIARVFSAFFILLQLIILLEFIYSINEYLLERDNCAFVLITVTGMLIAGSLVGMGFLYKVFNASIIPVLLISLHTSSFIVCMSNNTYIATECAQFWAPSSTCSLNIFFITWTLVLFLVYGFLSISPWRVESAGLMTSAAVFAYCMYYTWSALNSEPIGACAPEGGGGSGAVKIIAFIIALLSVGFVTMNSGQSSAAFSLRGRRTNESNDDAISEDAVNYRPDFFHLIFLLASSYMGMVLTGWGIGYDQEQFGLDKGWGSVWAKIVASWVCALLYGWSLIAHKVLPEREF